MHLQAIPIDRYDMLTINTLTKLTFPIALLFIGIREQCITGLLNLIYSSTCIIRTRYTSCKDFAPKRLCISAAIYLCKPTCVLPHQYCLPNINPFMQKHAHHRINKHLNYLFARLFIEKHAVISKA